MDKLFGMTIDNLRSYCESMIDFLAQDEDFAKFLEAPHLDAFSNYAWKEDRPSNIVAEHGQTKAVIYDVNDQFIIKIPFLFYGEIQDDGSIAPGAVQFDYCRAEARNYIVAMNEGLSNCFAPCYKLMDYTARNGFRVPIYVMERVSCDESEVDSSCREYVKINYLVDDENFYSSDTSIESAIDEVMDVDDPQISWIASQYCMAGLLEDFCNHNYINDVHCANIGYSLKDNRPKIIDYSGYGYISRVADEKEWWDVEQVLELL